MANKVILSKQYSWNFRDFINGAFLAIGTPVLYLLQEMIPVWQNDNLFGMGPGITVLIKTALGALVSYMIKTFVDQPKVTTTYSSNDKAVAVSEDITSSNEKA